MTNLFRYLKLGFAFAVLVSSISALAGPTIFLVRVQNHLSATNSQDTLELLTNVPPQIEVEKNLSQWVTPGKQVFGDYSIKYIGQNNHPWFPVLIAPPQSSFSCLVDVTLNYDENNGFYISYSEQEKGKPSFNCDVQTSGRNLIISADKI